jgi:N-terminal domain of galactosyltransferase
LYFHSSRLDNLVQAIRLLEHQEGSWLGECEVILVAHDHVPDLGRLPFGKSIQIDMNLDRYNKPKMCNAGVSAAHGDIVALLDSDRVLPKNYFRSRSSRLEPRTAVAPLYLFAMTQPHTDKEILAGQFFATADFRCPLNSSRRKNAFSGNTLFFRRDYLAVGGMDESFEGYGFADNDMVETFQRGGFRLLYDDSVELHLFHPKEIFTQGERLGRDRFRVQTLRNGIRFCKKHRVRPTEPLLDLYRELQLRPPTTDPESTLWIECQRLFNIMKI